jgi:hypothetical protein
MSNVQRSCDPMWMKGREAFPSNYILQEVIPQIKQSVPALLPPLGCVFACFPLIKTSNRYLIHYFDRNDDA